MTRSLLLIAALMITAPSIAFAETVGSSGGPAGGAFMSTYGNQAPRLAQGTAPRAEFAQQPALSREVTTTASTRRAVQRRSQ